MSDWSSLRYKRSVFKNWSLENGIRSYKDIISDVDVSWEMGSVLNDTVISDSDGSGSYNCWAVPDRGVLPSSYVSEDGGIWCNEGSLLDLGLFFSIC